MPQGMCKKVTKESLLMGDIMVCPETHQLLFHSWADTGKTHYVAIELGGAAGSRKYTIPYPYWPDYSPACYVPCRVTNACSTSPEGEE